MTTTDATDTTFFCHDGHAIFYPTAPGRIYTITFAALADCDGSASDFADSTVIVDIDGLLAHPSKGVAEARNLAPYSRHNVAIADPSDVDAWADWCDQNSETLDILDHAPGGVAVNAAA